MSQVIPRRLHERVSQPAPAAPEWRMLRSYLTQDNPGKSMKTILINTSFHNGSPERVASANRTKLNTTSALGVALAVLLLRDRKSTRLNSSHVAISYAVFC